MANGEYNMHEFYNNKVDVENGTGFGSGRGVFPQGSTISFHNVSYRIKDQGCCSSCKEGESKEIIKGIGGIMKPGLNAIMGPTGSGKSSLLDILAGRKDPAGLSGLVLVDGSPPPSDFRRSSGYVVQNDVIMGTLTVRESLWFSANLRLPRSKTQHEKREIVNNILNELSLNACADTKVGTNLIRGVSGGERKRTSIGIELITEPKILFLDEPTTGLDSSTANAVMLLLKRLSQKNRTVIFSIHQPRFSIYRLFDSLTLLSLGRITYHGLSSGALPYFSDLGFECEEHNNPADFFLDVINGDSSAIVRESITENEDISDENAKVNATSEELSSQFIQCEIYKESLEELAAIEKKYESTGRYTVKSGATYVTPFYYQFGMLCQRAFRNIIRNPIASVGNLVLNLIVGLVFGLIFLQVDDSINPGVQNRLGVLFFIATNLLFGSISALETFVNERDIFLHEYVSGYYRIIAYFGAKMIADLIPMRTIAPVIFGSVTYWMVGLNPEVGNFFFFMLTILLIGYAAVSIGLFYSASFDAFGIASIFLTLTFVFSIIFSGLLANIDSIVPWLAWLQYLSIARYGYAALCINEFQGMTFTQPNCTVNCEASGNMILYNNLAIGSADGIITDWDLWQNIVALGCIAAGMFTLTYIQLVRMKTYT